MAKRNLDNIRGSWLALVALACVGGILALGLGSERVRRAVRESLPAALGGGAGGSAAPAEEPPRDPDAGKKEKDPDALPDVPKEDGFRGLVRDSAGKPLPGATVTAERWRENRWEVLATARTNRQGEFVLGPVPRAFLSASARAEGYASERKPARTGARLEFSLKRGGTLAGKVVDAVTGEPVAGVYLSGGSGTGDWNENARTDREGLFRFASVPPGRIGLHVVPPEHQETGLNDLEVFEGKETFKEIPVVRGGTLRGKVVDRESKAPVAGARIRTWDGVKEAISGPDGRYELKSPPAGGVSLKASAPDYPEQWTWVQLSGDPMQEFERDVEISRGCRVSGVVQRPDGAPAPGARVGRDPGELMTGVPENTATTDAEGKFVLESVPAWGGMRIFAVADGFALSRSDPLQPRPGVEMGGVRIQLQAGATFRGTVKDEDGQPVSGVAVTFQRQWSPADGGGWFWIPELVSYSLADGTWELAGVPQGTWRVRAALEGFAPESRSSVNAPPEGTVEGQDFLLRRGSSITGCVRNREGDLLAGVSVTAWGWVMGSEGRMEWVARSEVRSDEKGQFTLDGLRDGTYEVQLQCPGFASLQMPGISAGTRDLQVTLMPMARLEGRVFDTDGATPCPTFTVRAYLEVDGDGNPQGPGNMVQSQDFADREGKFVLRDVPQGQYGLVAVSGNRVSRRLGGIIVGAGGSAADLRLTLSLGGKLRVTVRDASGTPLQNAQVSAGRLQPDGNFLYENWAQTDVEGLAQFAALADGAWTLWANYQNRVQETRTVSVGGGVEAEVEMVLRAGGSVLVHLRDAKGNPVEGAEVAFTDPATGQEIPLDWGRVWQRAWEKYQGRVDWNRVQQESTHTAADGTLLREGLKPGRVEVRARKAGLLDRSSTVTVQDGFEIDCDLPMEADPRAPSPGPRGTTPPAGDPGGERFDE